MLRAILYVLAALATASIANAAPPLEDYGKLPGVEFLTLSPSGERYAFVGTVGEDRRLVVLNAANEILEQANVGKAKVVSVFWAGNDHLLVETSTTVNMDMDFARQRDELASVIVVNPVKHTNFVVFANSRNIAHTVAGYFGSAQANGQWYGYFGGYSYDQTLGGGRLRMTDDGLIYSSLYRVNLDNGEATIASNDNGRSSDWLISPSGDVIAKSQFNQKSGDWKIVSQANAVLATGRFPDVEGDVIGFGRDPSKILIALTDDDGEKFIEQPLAGGAPTATYKQDEIGDLLFDRSTKLWIGSIKDQKASMFDAARQAKLRGALKAFPGYIASLASSSADYSRMIMFTEGADDSGTYWMVDTASGTAKEIGFPYPSVRSADTGPIRWFDYKAADGLAISGVLTLPPGRPEKALPLVVMPHGGPRAHDELQFDFWAQAFASRGYAVLQPNFRGSDDKGVEFLHAGEGQWGRKMQTDVSDGVAELARQGIIDPKRVCIVGASYGGYAALAGVTIQQGLYKCAVSVAGVADLMAQYRYIAEGHADSSVIAREWKKDLGLSSAQGNRIEDVSPIRLAARADAPILLIHGKDDTVVLPNQSDAMEKALRGAGKSVKLISVPGADHWWLKPEGRTTIVTESVNFVLEHNPPTP